MVWRTAGRLLNHHADTADCYQEVFLDAVQFARKYEVRNWQALLRRLATARAIDRLRQRYVKREAESTSLNELTAESVTAGSASDPTSLAQRNELADRLVAAIATLPGQQAEVFCLHCLSDVTYEDIAEQLNLNTNHVGVLLHRARAALQRKLVSVSTRCGSEVTP